MAGSTWARNHASYCAACSAVSNSEMRGSSSLSVAIQNGEESLGSFTRLDCHAAARLAMTVFSGFQVNGVYQQLFADRPALQVARMRGSRDVRSTPSRDAPSPCFLYAAREKRFSPYCGRFGLRTIMSGCGCGFLVAAAWAGRVPLATVILTPVSFSMALR